MTEYESAEEYESACQREQNRYGRERQRTTVSNMPSRFSKMEMFWAMLAVGILIAAILIGVGYTVANINIVPHQIYTLDGVQYRCEFPAPDVMECEQVGDPDVGFRREK